MFRLLLLGAMAGVGYGAYKFFKKNKNEKKEQSLEQNSTNCTDNCSNQTPSMA